MQQVAIYAAGDDEDEEDYEHQLAVATAGHHSARRAVYEPPALEDYVNEKLLEWAEEIPTRAIETLSIAIVAPDTDNKEVLALAHEILVAPGYYYRRSIVVNVPAVHADFYRYDLRRFSTTSCGSSSMAKGLGPRSRPQIKVTLGKVTTIFTATKRRCSVKSKGI